MFTSHPDYSEIIKNTGYLFWNPTDLMVESGWGTKLGFVENGVVWEPGHGYIELTQPETGDEPIIGIFTGNNSRVSVILRNYNAVALERLFPGLVTNTSIKFPSSIKTGNNYFATGHSGHLLFVPDDQTNHPCLLFQKAIPRISSTAKIRFSHTLQSLFSCVFTAARKSDDVDGILYVGPLLGATLR